MKTLILSLTVLIITVTAQAQSVDGILKDISVLTETNKVTHHKKASEAIQKYTTQYKIDHRIVLGLIMTESSFKQSAVSRTADFGIGQINYKVWSAEFIRLKKEPLDLKRLRTDVDYAIRRTVEILAILKKSNDPYWVGRYHSKTPSLKKAYFAKIHSQINKLEVKKSDMFLAVNN